MSDTRRYITPGWNPSHPNWHYDEMTEKHQARDKSAHKSTKNHRFSKGIRNSKYNLEQKIDDLKFKEELDINDVTCKKYHDMIPDPEDSTESGLICKKCGEKFSACW